MQWLRRAIAHPWVRQFILIGYGAKGALYSLIGLLTVQAALFPGEEAAGTYSTLAWIARQPLGKLLLWLLAIGLLGYVLRRILQAVLDPGHSFTLKRFAHRLGYGMSALSYGGVAYTAVNLTLEVGENDDTIEDLAHELAELPFGEWGIFFGGIAVASIGIGYLHGAWTGSYISEFQSSDIDHRLERWATRIGKLGVAARGMAFVIISVFLIQAALFARLEVAGGLENAFRTLQEQPLGWLWLMLVGVGFIAYGLYMFVAARYRRYAVR